MSPRTRGIYRAVLFLSVLFLVATSLAAAAPSITSLTPTSGAVGASVTIAGSGFGSTQGTSTVKFNGTTATITSWSATSIVAKVPTGATTGNVVVTVSGTASNGKSFTVLPTPSITSLSPTSGAVGASVTIAGSNFGGTQGSGTVKFNGTTATVSSWSASSIVATVPTGATTGNVVVNASGVNTNGISFTVVSAPSITSLSPTSGAVGSAVTIAGSNFGSTQGSSTVKFNGTTATVSSWSATSIGVTVPAGATTGNVVVHASGVDSNGKSFTVLPTPNITSLSPTSGTVGTPVTITGTNFGTTQGTSTVKFNGTTGTPTSWGSTSIAVPVPTGATTGNVIVTVSGVASNGVSFTVKTLQSISVTPQNPAVTSGNTQQFTATGTYSDNSTQNLTSTATWTSSIASVATINSSGLATAAAPGQTTIQATVGGISGSTVLIVPGFASTGSLITGRGTHTATLLNSGKVLVVGGFDNSSNVLASAELFDPVAKSFTATGSLFIGRVFHTASLLPDGRVLIAGGQDSSGNALSSAEIYDPASGTFTATGSMFTARQAHTATPLSDGRVLIVGGADSSFNSLSSAELFDPSSGSFNLTGNVNAARQAHRAVLLSNNKVLVAGGYASATTSVLASAEIYDPTTGSFSSTGNLNSARQSFAITLLNTGKILVTGGSGASAVLSSAELYDPAAGAFTPTGNMSSARYFHSATLLTNGIVFIGAGFDGTSTAQASAELFDPVAGSFSTAGSLINARDTHTATLLNSGMVLLVGGYGATGNSLASAELYEPATLTPSGLVSIAVLPVNPSVPAGTVQPFVATGTFSIGPTQTLNSVVWTSSNTGVATISNDSSNPGRASAITTGTSTINACDGPICGSTTLTVVASDPDIASLSPSSGPVGSSLTIAGDGFGAIQGSSLVTVDGLQATASSWTPTSITVIVPSNAQTANVVVTVGGVSSNFMEFTVLPTPFVATVSPTSGDLGAPLQISGQNFGDTQGSSTITLNGTAISVTNWSATSITGTVPAGATTGNIVVTVSGVASNSVSFTVLNVPAIFGLFPTLGPAGTTVTISGADFGASQGSSTVTFNGVLANVTGWSATSISVVVPTGATTGPVVVTASGAPSNGVLFVSPGPPNISSLSPATAPIGATITVNGTNFGASQGTSTVSFGNTLATVTSWSPTQIVVTVPTGAATGNVNVTASGVTGTAALFTVYTGPAVTSFSPATGDVGYTVYIQGSGFGATQGSSTVTFNGTPATATSWSDPQISVLVPSGATTGNLVVTVFGFSRNAGTFTEIPTPVITSISPSSGVIGTSLTITGMHFGATQGSGGVSFPGTCCFTPATSWSDTQIVTPLPSGAFSAYITVRASAGQFQTTAPSNPVFFTVLPSITNLSPASGTVATSVQINGTGFGFDQSTGTVTFNGIVASPTSWSQTQIVTNPPVGATTGNVVVTVSGNASAGMNFTVQAGPAISGLSPKNGVVGTSVTITGTGFGSPQGSSTVTFNGTTAVPSAWSATSITVPVPSGATTGNVVVTVGGVASNATAFTLDPVPSISSLSQNSGSIGTAITISGSNFLDTQGSSTVKFNGTVATPFFWSASSIGVNVPAGATTGNIVVTVLGQASAGKSFTVTAAPAISSLSPASGPVGLVVSVNGSNFGSSQGASSVTFNGASATPTSWASGLIKVPVPAGAITGPIVVTVNNGPSNNFTFTVTSGPGITSLSPTNGGTGATVTVSGAGFGASQGTSTVKFNGTTASPTSWSDGSIVVPVPSGATTGNVVVAVGGTASNGVNFTVASGLSVTALTPNSGNTGETVVISGTGFGATQGSSTIKFNGTTATATSWSSTSITTSVPQGATSGPLVATVGGAASDGIFFTAQPQVTAISPNPAAFNATITVTGENFGSTQGNSIVTCNGTEMTASTWSATSIVLQECANFGANSALTVPLQITVNGIPSATVALDIVPIASLSSVTPIVAPVGTPILIRGKNLGATQEQSTVTINGAAASPTSWSDTGIVVPVPTGAAPSGQINVFVAGQFAYPAIYSFQVGTLPTPSALQISPAGVNMLIGGIKQFNVVDNLGNPRPDATWSVDNGALASLSFNSSPITGNSAVLTALGAGQVTLTATVQGVSTQTIVNVLSGGSFPTGTVLWSTPTTTGYAASQFVQAVQLDYGPAIYSISKSSDGTQSLIQAFTSDGQLIGQSSTGVLAGDVIADAFGGILLMNACKASDPLNYPLTIVDTGAGWQGVFRQFSGSTAVCLQGLPKMAVRQDGAVVIAMPLAVTNPLMILSGSTGQQLIAPAIPPSTIQNTTGSINSCDCLTPLGQPIVDEDGSTYLEYEVRNISEFDRGGGPPSIGSELWLMKIAQDGTTTSTQISSSDSADLFPGRVIPDGQGALIATWAAVPIDVTAPPLTNPYQGAYVSSGVVTQFNMPMAPSQVTKDPNSGLPADLALVPGDSGTAFVSYGPNLTQFSGGSSVWNYQAPAQSTVSILSTASANGLVAQTATSSGTYANINFDAAGNAAPPSFSALNLAPWSGGTWLGILNNSVAEFADPAAAVPPPGWNEPQGGPHKQFNPKQPAIHTFVPFPYLLKQGSRNQADPASPARLVQFLKSRYGNQAEVQGFADNLATYPAFTKDLDTPIDVLGYIGHSFELGHPATSVGLFFYIKGPVFQTDAAIQHDSMALFNPATNATVKPEDVVQFQVTPKIIFIAACKTQAAFLKLWNIQDNVTKGHALVIAQVQPDQGENLLDAATAYVAFLDSLLAGNNVEKAKNDANKTIPNGAPFVVLGDHNVQIVKKPTK